MKSNLLYFYPSRATFVQKDIAILSGDYLVKTQDLPWTNKSLLPLNFLKQFFFILKNAKQSHVVIVMFGGYWSFLPALLGKLFHKKVFVILGGTDCVSFPEFNYGSLRKQPLRWFIKKSFQWAYKLLPVDDSLMFSNYNYLPNAMHKTQGVKAFFKNLKTPFTVIPNGFDTEFWDVKNATKKSKSFLSIAFVNDDTRLTLKGFDTVIKLARDFKEASFTLVGLTKRFANRLELPKNVRVYEYLNPSELKKEIAKHQFYLQLSLSEGFPNALAEAMLGQCIPIGTAVGGMPKIIGKTGVVLEQQNDVVLQEQIQKLLDLSEAELHTMGLSAKAQISDNFSLEKRAELLSLTLTED